MLPVSDAYKLAIKDSGRHIVARAFAYFDGEKLPPVDLSDRIAYIDLLEETQAESNYAIGSVSSNELDIRFSNDDRAFTQTNTESPFYGKIKPMVKIHVELGLEVSEDVYEYIDFGTYYTDDWYAPASSVEASVTCHDRLYYLGQQDTPSIRIQKNTTLYRLFELLFQALGLTSDDYWIDPNLTMPIKLGWLPTGNVRSTLQKMSIAGQCWVICNRAGKVIVRRIVSIDDPVSEQTSNNMIFGSESPQETMKIISKVNVKCNTPAIGDLTTVGQINDINVGGWSTLTLKDIAFANAVGSVQVVKLRGAKNCKITDIECSSTRITLTIQNTGDDEVVNIDIMGYAINTTSSTITVKDPKAVASIGERGVDIDSIFIQDPTVAKEVGLLYLHLGKNIGAHVTYASRGDPAIELFDVVTIDDPHDNLGRVDLLPIRCNYSYDGALSCTVTAIKTSALIIYDWVPISPGLSIYGPRKYRR